jgi:cation diffusion facilitator family transporter
MKVAHEHELPPDKAAVHAKAVRLEKITIVYLLSAVFFIYLTLGSSQAMKTAWFEDLLSLIPASVFLIAARIRDREPNERFPYGYHRVVSIAYLCASLALFGMGSFLLLDSILALTSFEHPSIGVVQLFGHQIWLGWLMLPALLWSAIPAAILGRMKLPLAAELHDKVLFADAKMNKADWLTAGAAMVGVLGIGIGLWWADAVAAAVISADILHDGWANLKTVVRDLMDGRPMNVDGSRRDPLPARAETEVKKLAWVRDATVRMREEGHIYLGEVFVVPTTEDGLVEKLEEAQQLVAKLSWRVRDLVIVPVKDLEGIRIEGRSHTAS